MRRGTLAVFTYHSSLLLLSVLGRVEAEDFLALP
jgi:hypothetical protein